MKRAYKLIEDGILKLKWKGKKGELIVSSSTYAQLSGTPQQKKAKVKELKGTFAGLLNNERQAKR